MEKISSLHKSAQSRLAKERYLHAASLSSVACLAAILAYLLANPHIDFGIECAAASSILVLLAATLEGFLFTDSRKLMADIELSEKRLWEAKRSIDIQTDEQLKSMRDIQMDKVRAMYRLIEFGRISSGIFHDISSPLTSLWIELENAEAWKSLPSNKHIPKTVARLKYLVSNARKHMQLTNAEELFDVPAEIESVIDLLRAKALAAGVTMQYAKRKRIALYGNKALFCHIIANLISNAIDAYEGVESGTGDFPRQVRISAFKNRSHTRIRVTDYGKGIPTDLMEKIFETFFTTKHGSGCGIGLSSSKYSLEKYFHGKMTASCEGGVTAFEVRIPKAKTRNA